MRMVSNRSLMRMVIPLCSQLSWALAFRNMRGFAVDGPALPLVRLLQNEGGNP